MASITLNHFFGRPIADRRGRGSGAVLVIGVAVNLALLGGFKYAKFSVDNPDLLLEVIGAPPVRYEARQ